ncbi:sodium/hydrogen exchanger, Na+, H+ antiporter, partial [Reticulomyxa filosa]
KNKNKNKNNNNNNISHTQSTNENELKNETIEYKKMMIRIRKELSSMIEHLTEIKLRRLQNVKEYWDKKIHEENKLVEVEKECHETEEELAKWRQQQVIQEEKERKLERRQSLVDDRVTTSIELLTDEEEDIQLFIPYDPKEDFTIIKSRFVEPFCFVFFSNLENKIPLFVMELELGSDLNRLYWLEDQIVCQRFEYYDKSISSTIRDRAQTMEKFEQQMAEMNNLFSSKQEDTLALIQHNPFPHSDAEIIEDDEADKYPNNDDSPTKPNKHANLDQGTQAAGVEVDKEKDDEEEQIVFEDETLSDSQTNIIHSNETIETNAIAQVQSQDHPIQSHKVEHVQVKPVWLVFFADVTNGETRVSLHKSMVNAAVIDELREIEAKRLSIKALNNNNEEVDESDDNNDNDNDDGNENDHDNAKENNNDGTHDKKSVINNSNGKDNSRGNKKVNERSDFDEVSRQGIIDAAKKQKNSIKKTEDLQEDGDDDEENIVFKSPTPSPSMPVGPGLPPFVEPEDSPEYLRVKEERGGDERVNNEQEDIHVSRRLYVFFFFFFGSKFVCLIQFELHQDPIIKH